MLTLKKRVKVQAVNKSKAKSLRLTGFSYGEIAKKLKIAKSTAYIWTRTAQLTETDSTHLLRRRENQLKQIQKLALINKERYRQIDIKIKYRAEKIVEGAIFNLHQKRILCSVLFWCEGGKDVNGGIHFINSDPILIRTFLKFLRESFHLDERKFRALVHIHEYHNRQKQEEFWSNITAIPLDQFYKSYLKPHTGKNKHTGYPGCVSVRYLDGSLGKLLKMIYIEFGKATLGVSVNW